MLLISAGFAIMLGVATAYEWLLILMISRPMVAFVLVLTDVSRE